MTDFKTPPFLKAYGMTNWRSRFILRLAAIIFPASMQRCHMYNEDDKRIASGWLHHESGCTFVTYMRDLKTLEKNMKVVNK